MNLAGLPVELFTHLEKLRFAALLWVFGLGVVTLDPGLKVAQLEEAPLGPAVDVAPLDP